MKSRHLLLALLAVSALPAAELRTFTSKDGRTVRAELVSTKADQVKLKREDGQTFTVNADSLSETDLSYIQMREKLANAAQAAADGRPEAPPNSVVIEALIDGPAELRVKKDGIYWINGGNAKPGRHEGQEEPIYVDDKSWRPNWKYPKQDRGVDRTATKSVEGIDPQKIDFKLLNVTVSRKGIGIEKRDAIQVNKIDGELSILIPDSQGGSRWYRFALVKYE